MLLLPSTLGILRRHRRSLLVFHLFFTGLALALLGPLFSAVLSALELVTGSGAISTGGMFAFLISPGGQLWLVVTLVATVFSFTLEQAGMSAIAGSVSRRGEYRLALSALWLVARRGTRLLWLSLVQVTAHLLLALPFLVLIALAWHLLLSSYDLYFLRVSRPPVLWWFLGIAAGSMVGILFCNGWLYLRWCLSVPIVVLEDASVRSALRSSSERVHGLRRQLTALLLTGTALLILLPILFTLVFQALGAPYLQLIPSQPAVLVPAITLYVALYLLLLIAVTFAVSAGYGSLIFSVYHHAHGHSLNHHLSHPPRRTGPLAWCAELALVLVAISQASVVVSSFGKADDVTVTAHRGGAFEVPENTRTALLRALDQGADYLEVDIRMTADGTLVLWHDANMERVFGLDGKISDLTWDQIKNRDAGSWFGPGFADERVATLKDAIEIARGRASLYVDIKPDDDTPSLTRDVVRLLQQEQAVEGTVVAAAEHHVLREARKLEPRLKTALLAQFVIGPLDEGSFDILGLRRNRASAAAVARARNQGYELHVWTVNQPAAMERFIDMGVDNIITDRPGVLTELLRERANLSNAERLAAKLHNWLR